MPPGDWSEWSEECRTIYPLGSGDDLPRKTTRNPFEFGEDSRDPDFPIGSVQASKLVTYCRQGTTWYRIDDYPLEEQLTEEQRERLGHPENGTCGRHGTDAARGVAPALRPARVGRVPAARSVEGAQRGPATGRQAALLRRRGLAAGRPPRQRL